jgi:error-prone DNA polymerase
VSGDVRPRPTRGKPDAKTGLLRFARNDAVEKTIIPFAEFGVTTNFSFLRGASGPEEFVEQAHKLGLRGLGIADRNSLAGVVRAYSFARLKEIKPEDLRLAIGCRLVFCDSTPDVLAYPQDRAAYARLTRLLTRGNLKGQKGLCRLEAADLLEATEGLQLVVLPTSTWEPEDEATKPGKVYADFLKDEADMAAIAPLHGKDDRETALRLVPNKITFLQSLAAAAPGRVWLAASMTYDSHMRHALAERVTLARRLNLPLLATNDVLMHDVARRPLQDVLTAIRNRTTLDTIGRKLQANAERHLKDGREMTRLFAEAPEAIDETLCFLEGLSFTLDDLKNQYPEELREGYATPQAALEAFAYAGAAERYKGAIPEKVKHTLAYELTLVAEMNYAPYFLTVHDIVRFAREQKPRILCQGRGSAANSTICYCLGITDVDPAQSSLLFERFISKDRGEPPDIDVDFEHERREEVMQYIYNRYGRARAGLTATVITYRSRSALRDVGKVFGLSEDAISALSSSLWGGASEGPQEKQIRRLGLDPREDRLAQTLALAQELVGFPRHLSQHTGGFVITRDRLDETVPIAHAAMDERTTVEWDKDDLDALGILKVDVLALGMLTCLRKGFDLLRLHYGIDHVIHTIPAEERAVYDMISRADTIGVFQIESRAQMSMLPRLKPQTFYDLVIEVAIVRPGPIQGDMVHPYLLRRQGVEPVDYHSEELKEVLGKTLGVPLFQEQAMKIAIVAAGFEPAEADKLRRAMATFKRVGIIDTFRTKMVEGMVKRNYPRDFAERCFKQIEGFGSYGFPESHAASFALLVYASAWIKCRYPDVFACALLNAQPMGFYAPAQIVRDAREHGVAIEEIDVNYSDWDCTLEEDATTFSSRLHTRHALMRNDIRSTHRLRLGLRQIQGVGKTDMEALVVNRGKGYDSIRDLWLRTDLAPSALAALAEADAFRSLGLDRRDALWAVRGLNRAGDKDDLPLLKDLSFRALEPEAHLPPMSLGEHVVEDYRHLSLSLKAHPVSFLRPHLKTEKIVRTQDLALMASGQRVRTAGLVLIRQRPGTASGVIFLTIEDETGIANAIVWPKIFENYRPIVIAARFVAITGRLQSESGVIHVVVERLDDLTPLLGILSRPDNSFTQPIKNPQRHPRNQMRLTPPTLFDTKTAQTTTDKRDDIHRVLPKGRNFH